QGGGRPPPGPGVHLALSHRRQPLPEQAAAPQAGALPALGGPRGAGRPRLRSAGRGRGSGRRPGGAPPLAGDAARPRRAAREPALRAGAGALRRIVLQAGGRGAGHHRRRGREPPLPRHAAAGGGAGSDGIAGFKRRGRTMTRGIEHDLMRLLHNELQADEARALRARIFREPELQALYDRLERTWQGLSLPPASPVPAGFTGRVMAHARSQASGSLSWSATPGWVRATAAAALVAGAALGLGVGRTWPAAGGGEAGSE